LKVKKLTLLKGEKVTEEVRRQVKYKCTCNQATSRSHIKHRNFMSFTEVDEEGVCVYCGHYAFKLYGNSVNASRGKRKCQGEGDGRNRKMVNGKWVSATTTYYDEVNIKENGTKNGVEILSGWSEIQRF
jgi:hypothetical protein